ncbi:MAG: DNA repair protein RecO [Parasulfuritortus sp.]|nr:DNA repair protein RecO [Parasulfuritortus sp.]
MGERVDNEAGFILHTRPYRETSLIVDVLSRNHGRLAVVARGARRPMSSIKSRLLGFQPLLLSWFGKGTLRTLHDAEWQGGDLRLQGDALMCGFYLNELLLKLLPADDPHERLYDRYAETLATLSAGAVAEPVLRRFELDLLSELGYAQTLSHDAEGERLQPDRRYGYVFDQGVVEAGRTGQAYAGKTLLDMAAGDFSDPRTLAEGKLLMRALLNHYLSDKPLLTRQLLIDLQQL